MQLSTEACIALKEMGLIQYGWSHYLVDEGGVYNLYPAAYLYNYKSPGENGVIAMPDVIDAFDWLEREQGWEWHKSFLAEHSFGFHRYQATNLILRRVAFSDDPSALIVAIHQHVKEVRA